MINIYIMFLPSYEEIYSKKEFLQFFLPKSEHIFFVKDRINKSSLLSLMAKILVHWSAKNHIKNYIPYSFTYKPQGKPFFSEYPDFHFSISHSSDYIACVTHTSSIGIDIEKKRAYNPALAKRFFSNEEFLFLESLQKTFQSKAFTSIWNLKESYVKYTGEGISNTFKTFSILSDGIHEHMHVNGVHKETVFKQFHNLPDYFISICSTNTDASHVNLQSITLESLL